MAYARKGEREENVDCARGGKWEVKKKRPYLKLCNKN